MEWFNELMQGEQAAIYEQGKLTFLVFPNKVVVMTSQQAFYLEPSRHYWNRRLKMIMRLIEINEIRDLNELASFTNPGINWVSTNKRNFLDMKPALA